MAAAFISATPHRDQLYEQCLDRHEVEDAWMALSFPGRLTVKLRDGISDAVAEQIADCLRNLPGEPWDLDVKHAE
jgi:hypothetical protein